MQPFFRDWADFTASQTSLTDLKIGFLYATIHEFECLSSDLRLSKAKFKCVVASQYEWSET